MSNTITAPPRPVMGEDARTRYTTTVSARRPFEEYLVGSHADEVLPTGRGRESRGGQPRELHQQRPRRPNRHQPVCNTQFQNKVQNGQ